MLKKSTANYYRENKERLKKKLVKDIKIFLRKKKNKSNDVVANVTKISQKMKSKYLLSIEKNLSFLSFFNKRIRKD